MPVSSRSNAVLVLLIAAGIATPLIPEPKHKTFDRTKRNADAHVCMPASATVVIPSLAMLSVQPQRCNCQTSSGGKVYCDQPSGLPDCSGGGTVRWLCTNFATFHRMRFASLYTSTVVQKPAWQRCWSIVLVYTEELNVTINISHFPFLDRFGQTGRTKNRIHRLGFNQSGCMACL